MITPSAFKVLQGRKKAIRANLVSIELPESTEQNKAYVYYTDFSRDLMYQGVRYRSTSMTGLGNIKHTRSLTAHKTNIKFSGLDDYQVDLALRKGASFISKSITAILVFLDYETEEYIQLTEEEPGLTILEGLITNVNISDSNSERGRSTITWEVANHFHNFQEVNGRLTDDNSHRGIVVSNGQFIPTNATKRPEYADDLGFEYANKTIDIMAKYQTKEQRFKMKSSRKGGFSGLVGGRNYSLVEYEVVVNREVDLRFDLSAKYIPVIYGVQEVTGVPIFADTVRDDPSQVFVAYAFCEGEIEGFLDLTIDDKPIICYDDQDDEERVCFGRKRVAGNTISMAAPNPTSSTGPSTHGQEYIYDDGQGEIRFWTYHGKPNQEASQILIETSQAGNFYLQGLLNKGLDYWSTNHKLLDTAYIVMKFKLSDLNGGRTNIPSVKAEVLGRKIPIYSTEGLVSSNTTSTIPAWQILDYIRSRIFGGKIPLGEVDLESFIEVASYQSALDNSYRASWVPFWRYIGWRDNSDSNKYLLQTNPLISTEEPTFKNLEELLAQSRCALNKINGKYTLSLEREEENPVSIDLDAEAISSITYKDLTGSKKFNTVMASIRDPALAWKNNAITMYNSEFKLQDRGIEKRLNLNFTSITNYYTARNLADRELKKSRFAGQLSITLPFYYIYRFVPNSNILISYARYGWLNQLFLVDEIDITPNGNINVTLERYGDGVFINTEQADDSSEQRPSVGNLVLPPRNLVYNPAGANGGLGVNGALTWLPSLSPNVVYYTVTWSGKEKADTVEVLDPKASLEYIVYGLPKGEYTFTVRAVNAEGAFSKPTSIVVNVSASINLPIVSGFRVVNLEPGYSTRFVGPDVILEWDPLNITDFPVGAYISNLQILDSNDTILQDLNISNTHTYTYTLAKNKADYTRTHAGTLGIHRDLKFKIRFITTLGGSSTDWAIIQ